MIENRATDAMAGMMHKALGTPLVSKAIRPGAAIPPRTSTEEPKRQTIVYFPSCPTRLFGDNPSSYDLLPTSQAMVALLERTGLDVVVPEHLQGLCCGQPFHSKGFPTEASKVAGRLVETLERYGTRVVSDASTCTKQLSAYRDRIVTLDSAEFLAAEVLNRVPDFRRIPSVAVHQNCSAQRMKEQAAIIAIAGAAAEVVIPLETISCCGFAGDKGLFVPELNKWATRHVATEIPADCLLGVSTVSACAAVDPACTNTLRLVGQPV